MHTPRTQCSVETKYKVIVMKLLEHVFQYNYILHVFVSTLTFCCKFSPDALKQVVTSIFFKHQLCFVRHQGRHTHVKHGW